MIWGLEPTYEGLKHKVVVSISSAGSYCLEPTYEGLKPAVQVLRGVSGANTLEPTYEGLKRARRDYIRGGPGGFGAYL